MRYIKCIYLTPRLTTTAVKLIELVLKFSDDSKQILLIRNFIKYEGFWQFEFLSVNRYVLSRVFFYDW
jgi:hypothetical protein